MAQSGKHLWRTCLTGLLVLGLSALPAFAAAPDMAHGSGHKHNSAVERPAWLEKLENQVNYEEMMEGKSGDQEQLDKTFKNLMDRLQGKLKEHASPASVRPWERW